MTRLNFAQFKELAAVHGPACISLYLPTHRYGQEVNSGKDPAVFRNLVREAWHILADKGFSHAEVQAWLDPAELLLKDPQFWKYRNDGLAVFLNNGVMHYFEVPQSFTPSVHVGSRFHLLPLMNLPHLRFDFYLLLLQVERVRLFRCFEEGYREVDLPARVPHALEEYTGEEREQRNLQVRNLSRTRHLSVVHGQGEGHDDSKQEIHEFLRAINKGLTPFLQSDQLPLLVAGLPQLFAEYQSVNTYHKLCAQSLNGGHVNWKVDQLRTEGLRLIQQPALRARNERAEMYRQRMGTARASNELDQIIPAALAGQVDSLFIRDDADRQGYFDRATGRVSQHATTADANCSLFNLVAIETCLRGGNVYLVDEADMPDGYSAINALFRY